MLHSTKNTYYADYKRNISWQSFKQQMLSAFPLTLNEQDCVKEYNRPTMEQRGETKDQTPDRARSYSVSNESDIHCYETKLYYPRFSYQ